MKVGETVPAPFPMTDKTHCPLCNSVEFDRFGDHACGFFGFWRDGGKSIQIEKMCLNYRQSDVKGTHPCKCDLHTVLMVKGCQCGGR